MNFLLNNFIFKQNEHKIIALESFEGLRNLTITSVIIISILILGRYLNKESKVLLAKSICVLAIVLISYDHLINVINGNWEIHVDLPLHLCSISNLITCIILFIPKNNKLFEFLFYS